MKKTIIAILILAALALIAGILIPNKFESSYHMELRMSQGAAFGVLSNMQTYTHWFIPTQDKLDGTPQISGIDGIVGTELVYLKNNKPAKVKITSIRPLEDVQLRAEYPNNRYRSYNHLFRIQSKAGNTVVIEWQKQQIIQFPHNITAFFYGRHKRGKAEHKSAFERLENYLQTQFPTNVFDGFEIRRVHLPGYHLIHSDWWSVPLFSANEFNDEVFNRLAVYVGNLNIGSAGMPLKMEVAYIVGDSIKRSLAIPLSEARSSDSFGYKYFRGGEALQVLYRGSGIQAGKARQALMDYVQTYQIAVRDTLIEEHLSFPEETEEGVSVFHAQFLLFIE